MARKGGMMILRIHGIGRPGSAAIWRSARCTYPPQEQALRFIPGLTLSLSPPAGGSTLWPSNR
eukprot:3944234-Pyramimonas_sp.AAC.1